jgi:hypothetical protein
MVSSYFIRSVTSEQLIEDFVKMLGEHFSVSAEWHRRLMDSVQLNSLRTSINEGHLDKVNEKINQIGDVHLFLYFNSNLPLLDHCTRCCYFIHFD